MSYDTRPARVVIVDDSNVARSVLRAAISADPQLELVGEAASGRNLVDLVHQAQPDVLLLDVEMPDVDGLTALSTLRESWPFLPVVMFSTLTATGTATTIDALARGATDYVAKPSSGTNARRHIDEEVLPRLRRSIRRLTPLPPPRQKWAGPRPSAPRRTELVVVGSSTGGPNALTQMFVELPASFPAPVLVAQHLPSTFTPLLADRLSKSSKLQVHEAKDGQRMLPGNIYIAPGERHLAVGLGGVLKILDTPPVNSCKPSVDVLFSSAAEQFGASVLAVLLTGMGTDGTNGAREIVNAGGGLVCQDQETSVIWGMPGSAVRAGLPYAVLPIDRIGKELIARTGTR